MASACTVYLYRCTYVSSIYIHVAALCFPEQNSYWIAIIVCKYSAMSCTCIDKNCEYHYTDTCAINRYS